MVSSAQRWRVLALSSLGGALEYYDFVVYAIFAPYLAAAFFPARDPLTGLLVAFAVFAVGYLARPFGGLVLSHFGDRFGRRRVNHDTLLTMSAATAGMGLLPSYASIGLAASVGMVLLRLLQGFVLGGELAGAITYVSETSPSPAAVSVGCGAIFACVNSGVLLAALVSLAVHTSLPPAAVAAWGWRLGFLAGGVVGLVGFWLRLSLEETPAFAERRAIVVKAPIAEVVQRFPGQILTGIAVLGTMAGFNGLIFAHLPAYLTRIAHYDPIAATTAQNVCLAVMSVGLFLSALASTVVGRRRLLQAGAVLLLIFGYPFYAALAGHRFDLTATLVVAALVSALGNGVFAAIVADLFPTPVRFTGVATVLNLAVTLFSGFGPLIATWLIARTGDPASPGWFLAACAAIALAGSLALPRYEGQLALETSPP